MNGKSERKVKFTRASSPALIRDFAAISEQREWRVRSTKGREEKKQKKICKVYDRFATDNKYLTGLLNVRKDNAETRGCV